MARYAHSIAAVARVQRLDGGSRVVAVNRGPETGWERAPRKLLLTHESLHRLRDQGVRTVRLRRGLFTGVVPLIWFREAPRPPAE